MSQLSKVIALAKCALTILELNWNQRLWDSKTKFDICHHMLTLSTYPQNRSFHVVERTRTSSKCQKMKNARAKRVKILLFVVKYANLWGFCSRRCRGCLISLLSFVGTIIYARADLQIFRRLTFYFCFSSTEFSHYWPSWIANSDLTKKRWKIIYLQPRPHLTNIRKMRQKKSIKSPAEKLSWTTIKKLTCIRL